MNRNDSHPNDRVKNLKTLEMGGCRTSFKTDVRYAVNKLDEKLINWLTGFGYSTNIEKSLEIEILRRHLATLSEKDRERLLVNMGLNCEVPGAKSGLMCWRNTKTVGEVILTSGALRSAPVVRSELQLTKEIVFPDPKFAAQLERQLAKDGVQSVKKSLSSLEQRLAEHRLKLDSLPYKSSVEREIRTFEKQIETIRLFFQEKGIKP